MAQKVTYFMAERVVNRSIEITCELEFCQLPRLLTLRNICTIRRTGRRHDMNLIWRHYYMHYNEHAGAEYDKKE